MCSETHQLQARTRALRFSAAEVWPASRPRSSEGPTPPRFRSRLRASSPGLTGPFSDERGSGTKHVIPLTSTVLCNNSADYDQRARETNATFEVRLRNSTRTGSACIWNFIRYMQSMRRKYNFTFRFLTNSMQDGRRRGPAEEISHTFKQHSSPAPRPCPLAPPTVTDLFRHRLPSPPLGTSTQPRHTSGSAP